MPILLILILFFTSLPTLADEASDTQAPLVRPRFSDPYADLSDAALLGRVKPLPALQRVLRKSIDLRSQVAASAPSEGFDVELRLPKNLCEAGTITWGSPQSGYRSCKALGRGQTVFGSLRLLAGLKKTQSAYKSWTIGQLPMRLRSTIDIKHREHFGTDTSYEYCMYKPDTESNGASVSERPGSQVGHYLLDTGPTLHSGKQKWGERSEGMSGEGRYILPVRMTRVVHESNRPWLRVGRLLSRSDFWIHSHELIRNDAPLEGLSTWGCPRLPQSCQVEFQAWVAAENAAGRQPKLRIVQESDAGGDPVEPVADESGEESPAGGDDSPNSETYH